MIKKVMDTIAKCIEILTVVVFIILFLVVVLQMVSRWSNMTNVGWTDEMISCFTTWMVFLGCSYLVEQDGHISVDLFAEKLSPLMQKMLRVLIQLLNLVCAGFVVYSSQLWLKTTVGKVTPILQIQYNIWYTALLVFGILFTFFAIYKFCCAVAELVKKGPEA